MRIGWNEKILLADGAGVEIFDAVVCAILAVGCIMRKNDQGEITCKFQPCYFYCQIPLLANSAPQADFDSKSARALTKLNAR